MALLILRFDAECPFGLPVPFSFALTPCDAARTPFGFLHAAHTIGSPWCLNLYPYAVDVFSMAPHCVQVSSFSRAATRHGRHLVGTPCFFT